MKTLAKIGLSAVIVGVLNGCAVYPSHHHQGYGHRHSDYRYPNSRNSNHYYSGYRRPYYGYNHYGPRPYCRDDD